MRLDLFLDFPLHRVQIESGWRLHWRKVDSRFRQLRYRLLYDDEAPEFSRHEIVHVAAAEIIHVFAADRRSPFERILAEVDNHRHVRRDLFPWPALRLLVELEFEIINPEGTQVRTAEVKEFMTSGGTIAQQQIYLIVAVEVVLVGTLTQLHPFQELNLDVGITGGIRKRGQPVEPGEDVIHNGARLDLARPTNDCGHAEAAFISGAFSGLKRRHPAVWPGEYFRPVVGGEDDDGVFGLAYILQMLQK